MATSALALANQIYLDDNGVELPDQFVKMAMAMKSVMGPMFDIQSQQFGAKVQVFCDRLQQMQIPPGNDQGHRHPPKSKCCGDCDGCKRGGSCDVDFDGHCDPLEALHDVNIMGYIQGMLQKCRLCRRIDKCVAWMYLEDRRDLDSAAWEQLLAKDGQLVHIDKFVGIGPNYVDFPLAANQKWLGTQSDEQQLSFWPEIIKLSPDWTGTPVPSKVIVRWWSGEKGLTGLTGTSQLIQLGESQTLSDYACGDSCYVIPFPSVKMCPMGHIPRRRAIYLEVETKAIGAAEITGINATIIKRGTEMWERWAPLCKNKGSCKV